MLFDGTQVLSVKNDSDKESEDQKISEDLGLEIK